MTGARCAAGSPFRASICAAAASPRATDLQAKYTLAPTSTQNVLHHIPTAKIHPGTYMYTTCAAPHTCRSSTPWHLQVQNMLHHRNAGQVHPDTYKYTTCAVTQTYRPSTPRHLQVQNMCCTTDLQAKYTSCYQIHSCLKAHTSVCSCYYGNIPLATRSTAVSKRIPVFAPVTMVTYLLLPDPQLSQSAYQCLLLLLW